MLCLRKSKYEPCNQSEIRNQILTKGGDTALHDNKVGKVLLSLLVAQLQIHEPQKQKLHISSVAGSPDAPLSALNCVKMCTFLPKILECG